MRAEVGALSVKKLPTSRRLSDRDQTKFTQGLSGVRRETHPVSSRCESLRQAGGRASKPNPASRRIDDFDAVPHRGLGVGQVDLEVQGSSRRTSRESGDASGSIRLKRDRLGIARRCPPGKQGSQEGQKEHRGSSNIPSQPMIRQANGVWASSATSGDLFRRCGFHEANIVVGLSEDLLTSFTNEQVLLKVRRVVVAKPTK